MKNIVRTTLAVAIGLSLSACYSESNYTPPTTTPPAETPTTTVDLTGKAVKGTLIGADVAVYLAADMTAPVATTTTDETGSYTVTIEDSTGAAIAAPYVVNISATDKSSMICDAAMCGELERGETMSGEQLAGIKLSTITYVSAAAEANSGLDTATAVMADANMFTTLATTTMLETINSNEDIGFAGISPESFVQQQVFASELVGTMIDPTEDFSDINMFNINVIDAVDSDAVVELSEIAQKFTLINASYAGITATDEETFSEALNSYIVAVTDIMEQYKAAEEGEEIIVDPVDFAILNWVQDQVVANADALITEIATDTGETLEVDIPDEITEEALGKSFESIEVPVITGTTGGTGDE